MAAISDTAGSYAGLFARERTIANAGFNRWLMPPAALAIHLCIGMAFLLLVGLVCNLLMKPVAALL